MGRKFEEKKLVMEVVREAEEMELVTEVRIIEFLIFRFDGYIT